MKEIILNNAQKALVDDSDIHLVDKFKWYALRFKNVTYACTNVNHKTILMHHLIYGKHDNLQIDHRDGDGLNNQKSNLRFATKHQNAYNVGKRKGKNHTSKYKGVCRKDNRWVAQIMFKGKKIHLGLYKTEIEAAHSYNEGAKKYHGEFAWTNTII